MARDKARTTAWILITVLTALFMVGLVLVSFWGGPFEADSLVDHLLDCDAHRVVWHQHQAVEAQARHG